MASLPAKPSTSAHADQTAAAAPTASLDFSAFYAQQGYTAVPAASNSGTGYSNGYSSNAVAGPSGTGYTSAGYDYSAYGSAGAGYGYDTSYGAGGAYGATDEELAAQQSICESCLSVVDTTADIVCCQTMLIMQRERSSQRKLKKVKRGGQSCAKVPARFGRMRH